MTNRGLLWLFDDALSFKQIPPPRDQETFGKLLLCCANGDGKITPAERAWVLGFLDAFGAPQEVIEKLNTYDGKDDVAKIVEASPLMKKSASAAIFDAIRACYADGVIAPGEKTTLEKAATAMGVEASKVGLLIELYEEERRLKSKRLGLMFPSGVPFQG